MVGFLKKNMALCGFEHHRLGQLTVSLLLISWLQVEILGTLSTDQAFHPSSSVKVSASLSEAWGVPQNLNHTRSVFVELVPLFAGQRKK